MKKCSFLTLKMHAPARTCTHILNILPRPLAQKLQHPHAKTQVYNHKCKHAGMHTHQQFGTGDIQSNSSFKSTKNVCPMWKARPSTTLHQAICKFLEILGLSNVDSDAYDNDDVEKYHEQYGPCLTKKIGSN